MARLRPGTALRVTDLGMRRGEVAYADVDPVRGNEANEDAR